MEWLILVILIGLIPAAIAKSKGRSFAVWWFYGSALFIVALPHALIMRPSLDGIERRQAASGLRKCPFCAEMIKPEAVVCRFCNRDLPKPDPVVIAPQTTDTANRTTAAGMTSGFKVLLICLLLFAAAFLLNKFINEPSTRNRVPSAGPSVSSQRPPPGDDAAYFIWKYGPPDLDESTDAEVPRPKIVTRWLTYKKERVRMIYSADAPPGSPPPYKGWKIMGALDGQHDQNLSPDEIARRMAPRKRHG
jgi:hypothetical protein